MKPVVLCTIALIALAPAGARAGVVFETANPKGQNRVSMEGDHVRVETNSPGEGLHIVLIDTAARTLTALSPKDKTFVKMEIAKLEAMATQNNERLRESLAKLSPEERKRVEANMRAHGQALPTDGTPEPELKFESMKKKDKVAGFACEWFRGARGEKTVVEGCYIPWPSTGLSKDDLAPVMKTLDSLQTLATRMGRGENGKGDWQKAPGFPGITTRFLPSGEKGPEDRLVSLKRISVPADQFQVPADYHANSPPH